MGSLSKIDIIHKLYIIMDYGLRNHGVVWNISVCFVVDVVCSVAVICCVMRLDDGDK